MAPQYNSASNMPETGGICPSCLKGHRPGELVCPNCGFSLSANVGQTRQIERPHLLPSDKGWAVPNEILASKTIVLEIGKAQVTLPSSHNVIVGRGGKTADKVDIDLSQFDAADKGVSRQHVRISREALIYVTDLASTNGTFLNGERLFPNSDCPLNDGDELVLGTLKIKVRLL